MADQSALPEDVTPSLFFEQLMPMGFAAQVESGGTRPGDITLKYVLTGSGGGSWMVDIRDGTMIVRQGDEDAAIATTVSTDDWRDAAHGRNGASLVLIIPQQRPGRPDNTPRVKLLKGTMALELSRDGDPFRVEMCFNSAVAPRTIMKVKLADYVDMQTGKLNGQEAFMTGKLKVEGDLAFLMQIAALTA
jgi:putative sterol carrier protein